MKIELSLYSRFDSQLFKIVLGFLFIVITFIAILTKWNLWGGVYGSLDGLFYLQTILTRFHLGEPFATTGIDPIQGVGGILYPMNVWINPITIPFAITELASATRFSAFAALFIYSGTSFVLARTAKLPFFWCIVAAQLSAAAFAPFTTFFGSTNQFILNPTVSLIYSGLIALSLVVRRLRWEGKSSIPLFILTVCVGEAILVYLHFVDAFWLLAGTMTLSISLITLSLAASKTQDQLARLVAALMIVIGFYLLGGIAFLVSVLENSHRWIMADQITDPKLSFIFSRVFNPDGTIRINAMISYAVIFAGIIIASFRSGASKCPITLAAIFGLLLYGGIGAYFWLGTRYFGLPKPMYFEQSLIQILIVAACVGFCSISRRFEVAKQLQFLTVGVPIVLMAAIPVTFIKAAPTPWAPFDTNEYALVDYLTKEIGLRHNREFRGSLAFVNDSHYNRALTLESLRSKGIPTMNQYGQVLSALLWVFMDDFLGGASQNRTAFRPPENKNQLKLLRMMGVRYILHDDKVMDLRPVKTFKKPYPHKNQEWYVYELSDPNIASYSPTRVIKVSSPDQLVVRLRQPDFDPEEEVLVPAWPVPIPRLVPGTGRFSYENGSIAFSARSKDWSLSVLPIQFSRCFKVSGRGKARLIPVNMLLTGVLYKGNVNILIRNQLGPLNSECFSLDAKFARKILKRVAK